MAREGVEVMEEARVLRVQHRQLFFGSAGGGGGEEAVRTMDFDECLWCTQVGLRFGTNGV